VKLRQQKRRGIRGVAPFRTDNKGYFNSNQGKPMKRDLNVVLMMPDKITPMTHGDTPLPLTMGVLISEACVTMYPTETMPDQKEKTTRFRLSVRTALGGIQSFTKYEMDVMLKAAYLKCGAWLYGQVDAWAEGINPFGNPQALVDAAEKTDPDDVHTNVAA